jgi:hypothetical protein
MKPSLLRYGCYLLAFLLLAVLLVFTGPVVFVSIAAQVPATAPNAWAHEQVLSTLPNRSHAPRGPLRGVALDSVFRYLLRDMSPRSLVAVRAGAGLPQPLLPLPGRVVAPLNPEPGYAWAGMSGATYRLAAWRVPYRVTLRNLNTYRQPMGIKRTGNGVWQLVLVDSREPRPEGLQRLVAVGDTFSVHGTFLVYDCGLPSYVALHPYPGTLPGDSGYGKLIIPAQLPAAGSASSPATLPGRKGR